MKNYARTWPNTGFISTTYYLGEKTTFTKTGLVLTRLRFVSLLIGKISKHKLMHEEVSWRKVLFWVVVVSRTPSALITLQKKQTHPLLPTCPRLTSLGEVITLRLLSLTGFYPRLQATLA